MEELFPINNNLFESLSVHKEMLQDKIRLAAYDKAIKQTVRKESVVVDIGTGTGLLAFLAVRAGARRVYAIERSKIVRLAEAIASANSMSKRIVFIKGDSRNVTIPEKADILMSEVLGHCVLDENMLDSVIDGRCRFLKQGGKVIPQTVEMFFVPVYDEKAHEELIFWKERICKIDYAQSWTKAVNNVYVCPWNHQFFPAEPQVLATIDLASVNKVDLSGKSSFSVTRNGMINGFASWFKATLDYRNEVAINTGPGKAGTHWGYAFFPIEKPVPVKKGQTINFELTCYSDSDSTTWEWAGDILSNGKLFSRYQHSTGLY